MVNFDLIVKWISLGAIGFGEWYAWFNETGIKQFFLVGLFGVAGVILLRFGGLFPKEKKGGG